MKILTHLFHSIIVLGLLLIFSWSIIFQAYYLAFISLLGSLLLFPVYLHNKGLTRIRYSLLSILLIGFALTFNLSIAEIHNRLSILAKQTRSADSTAAFTLRDKLGIYGLNIVMAASAYPVYPEISRQTLLMIFPRPDNQLRVFESDFALQSKKIRLILSSFIRSLDKRGQTDTVSLEQRVHWDARDYRFGHAESRYALALNPSNMTLTATRQQTKWLISVSLKVLCDYPQNSRVTLIEEPELAIEEGLFWVLQQEGWLHPYTADWRFQIDSDDRRLTSAI